MKLKTFLLDTTVSFGVGFAVAVALHHVLPGPLPVLPKHILVEKVVTKIVEVPGKPAPVERLRVVTKTKAVPKEVLREVIKFERPEGRARMEANRFHGMRDGQESFGWSGKILCEMQDGSSSSGWTTLFDSPFDLSASTAEITREALPPPATPAHVRFRLDGGVGLATGLRPSYMLGVSRTFSPRSRVLRALAPTSVGGQLILVGGTPVALVTVGKEL